MSNLLSSGSIDPPMKSENQDDAQKYQFIHKPLNNVVEELSNENKTEHEEVSYF
mgnify:FL=1